MPLVPEDLKGKIPGIGLDSDPPSRETTVYLKYVLPSTKWRWYVLGFDGEATFFGIVVNQTTAVMGQFTVAELESLATEDEVGRRTPVSRDADFVPLTLEQLALVEPAVPVLLSQLLPQGDGSGEDLVSLDDKT